MGRRNIWRHNSQESSKINDRHQTTDPRISEDTKKDKYKTKPNNTAPHTYRDRIQTAENKDKDKILKTAKGRGKKNMLNIGTKTWIIADFSLETT